MSTFEIRPDRGALVTELEVDGVPVLFLDEQTLRDPTKNVRGGVPVLFPTPGKLRDDRWTWRGKGGPLKQHGFARTLPWIERPSDLGSRVLALAWPGAEGWPWACTLELRCVPRDRGLLLEQRVTNDSDEEMPFGMGFHPYFFVPDADKRHARIPTRATRAFDNVTKQEITLDARGIDLTQPEVDLHLLDHGASEAWLELGRRTIRLRGSAEYRRWVVWTLAGKDFVCLEPWTCPADAMNTGEDLLMLAPGDTRRLSLEMDVVST